MLSWNSVAGLLKKEGVKLQLKADSFVVHSNGYLPAPDYIKFLL